ncbi:unnamed protein product [Ilex paraguariensis]|uniref:GATA transcription factor n=1 Tax=Ilex paraguariensis TaxID=185542 RepID=A0ABC8RNU6_9AQUA
MDMCGEFSTPDYFRIDDLLDFSNDDLFSSTTATDSSSDHQHANTSAAANQFHTSNPNHSLTDFTDDLCVPNDDVAQLEWLSTFVDDSFSDFPTNNFAGTINVKYNSSFHSCSPRKRSKSTTSTWTSSHSTIANPSSKPDTTNSNDTMKRESAFTRDRSASREMVGRRCTHCASEKTPQWRTGPLGPKTLCNACGVRFKSGRLVPEYRPAASPTFVLTQHSNSHRKVLELQRQKEHLRQQQPDPPQMNHQQHNTVTSRTADVISNTCQHPRVFHGEFFTSLS